MTLIGKGLAWGQLPPNEIYHFKSTGNELKIVWAVGPFLHNEIVEVRILNLATGRSIPAALVTSHGSDPTADKIAMDPSGQISSIIPNRVGMSEDPSFNFLHPDVIRWR